MEIFLSNTPNQVIRLPICSSNTQKQDLMWTLFSITTRSIAPLSLHKFLMPKDDGPQSILGHQLSIALING